MLGRTSSRCPGRNPEILSVSVFLSRCIDRGWPHVIEWVTSRFGRPSSNVTVRRVACPPSSLVFLNPREDVSKFLLLFLPSSPMFRHFFRFFFFCIAIPHCSTLFLSTWRHSFSSFFSIIYNNNVLLNFSNTLIVLYQFYNFWCFLLTFYCSIYPFPWFPSPRSFYFLLSFFCVRFARILGLPSRNIWHGCRIIL